MYNNNLKTDSENQKMNIKNYLKVVHVVPAFPPNLGGMEQRVKELVDRLHTEGVPLEVITSDLGTKPGRVVEDGVPIQRLQKIGFLQTPISFRLPFTLLAVKADVFHVHVAQPFFPIVAAFIATLRRKPYIMHIRAIVESEHFFGKILVYVYKKVFLKVILRGAAKCIILTDTYRDILVRDYGVKESRVVTIPNATDFSILPNPRSSVAESSAVNLLAVGRLDHQKNYPFMLRMLAELQKLGNFTLTIVGSGADEETLKQYAVELGIEDRVIWKGRLHGQELEDVYERTDIFVHTAYFEGFGTVFIEAMAKGLPICASKVLGAVDVVQDGKNGLLCDFDEVAFAQKIHTLAQNNTLYFEVSRNNLASVLQYRWEDILARTINLYNEM
jgi:glycosyltransferase involved in cell wall biosynthesis